MSEQALSRRNFLKVAGLALGGTVLACSGAGVVATRQPQIDFIQTNCGGQNVSDKILIAYASKCGSTGEVAEAIGQALCAQGASVDVKLAKDVSSLDGYRMVVIGSAIRMGRWLSDATKLVEAHQARLSQLPTAIFTVHLTNLGDDDASRQARASYTAPVKQLVTPQAEAFFAGKMELARLAILDRIISKAMKAEDQDLRDWDAIQTWAAQLQV